MNTPYQTGYVPPTCPYCGYQPHPGGVVGCPNVKKVEYYPDGTIKTIEKK